MAGSIWNKNSWHWEEKNYNKWGESYIKSKLIHLKIEDEDLSIYFDTINITGNASVSIRKGKQISSFEFVIKFKWNCLRKKENINSFGGDVEILDFSNCSLEDNDYEINVEANESNADMKKAYAILRKEGKEKIKNTLKDFQIELLKHDTNESSKELKIKETEEEKLKDIKINYNDNVKIQQDINNDNNVNKIQNDEKKEGSVWNINNYHWEEKCLTKWAKEELEKTLNSSTIELNNNIYMQFFNAEIEGEASSSLRKKKKIIIYDLKIGAEWKASKKNKNNEIEMEAKGYICVNEIISDFSADDENKYKYTYIFDNKTPEYSTINDVVKSDTPQKINEIIDAFVEKMKQK
ncbi:activator of Hsp90 ATPase, putative [Plasmodium chabaudi chabaudi]|uniref:Activator of Hsp90 ATPase, putative n=2 Tax=Plasmodium chabaudi TaxID=5825 RepID=A0A077THC6_PLACU|nr:activator of Hsp90 ATPase, putative [Plasmodium chabaudi chabaudi]SCL98147.1 activator of Hsp90 ATPase, putative [Plasmodium chabaudi chabaudi]SCM06118.1 activator of Hsp90 ATPase, putative [Plasmodium chabaudi adami]VTZ67181.1 activator of Hsp90 ATPase, putative [Plasmodium chabaudi chabaudi]|eukprot:XP_016653269.1 activator of Hsp90 ATPase, putative [Plasmodium chabaudi chabaudi]